MESIIDQFFDMVYYINMEKDVDRNQSVLNQFKKFNITKFKRVEGVVVKDIPEEGLYRSFIKRDEKYIRGHLGARKSHLSIVADAKLNGYNRILIFEDDVDFKMDPNALINGNWFNIQNFDLLYFGGLQEQHFRNQIVEVHAYAIGSRIFDDILYMCEPSGMEIDNFYAKVLQHMSKNNRVGGQCIVKKVEPFNAITQKKEFNSNIV